MRLPLVLLAVVAVLPTIVACSGSDDTGDEAPAGTAGAAGDAGAGGSAAGGKGGSAAAGKGGAAGASGGSAGGGAGGAGGAGGSAGGGAAGSAGASGGGAAGAAGAGGGGSGGASGAGSAGASGAGAAGKGGSGGSGGAGASGGAGSGGAGGSPYGCSADLQAIVDANGAVVATCPADKGCAGGTCVDACAAASVSGGSVGCEFHVPTPRTYGPTLQPCHAAFLANTWGKPAKIVVTRGAATYDATKFGRIAEKGKTPDQWAAVPASGIPTGEVGVLFLSSDPNSVFVENGYPLTCPAPTATGAATELPGTGKASAFRIATDVPVSAYDIFPFGGAHSHFPSAELLFPRATFGTSYVVLATPKGTSATPGPLFGQVLAVEDGTQIDILPSVNLPAGGGLPAMAKGVKATFTLDAGQYAQWELPSSSLDMSGTILASQKPITVVAGSRFFRQQTVEAPGGEATHHQIQPVSALGSEYVAAPYETRRKDMAEESVLYRIVGAVDGTGLTFDPPVAGAPKTVGRAEVADFFATGAFRVTSQDADHPFAMAQIMTSANVPGGSRSGAVVTFPGLPLALGDEEVLVMLPPGQFLSRYVFFSDPTYATTNLVLTRRKTPKGFLDVTVECLGKVTGWAPVGTSGEYEMARVDLLRANVPNGTCANGRQLASSDGPFGLVVWGLDTYSSYAYAAGGNAAKLTGAVVKPLSGIARLRSTARPRSPPTRARRHRRRRGARSRRRRDPTRSGASGPARAACPPP